MNSFINAILSLMLSWIRALITRLWSLITSESGGELFRFFSQNWLKMVGVLCAAGIVADLIVYFFRWRPDYVWRSRLHRFRREPEPVEEPVPVEDHATQVYRPVAPQSYAPLNQRQPVCAPTTAATQTYAAVQDLEPVFDEEAYAWESGPVEPEWQPEELPAYGQAQPEPAALYHDIQSGFAPAVSPEQLYVPSASYQSPHPGLNEEAFRQSFGLQTDEEAQQDRAIPVMYAPAFRPFTVKDEEEEAPAPSRLSRLARRARTFVGVDEEDRPTIRDLQNTVDVSQAFHAPVYPQPLDKGGYDA